MQVSKGILVIISAFPKIWPPVQNTAWQRKCAGVREITRLQTAVPGSKVSHYGILCKLWQPSGWTVLSQVRGCSECPEWYRGGGDGPFGPGCRGINGQPSLCTMLSSVALCR